MITSTGNTHHFPTRTSWLVDAKLNSTKSAYLRLLICPGTVRMNSHATHLEPIVSMSLSLWGSIGRSFAHKNTKYCRWSTAFLPQLQAPTPTSPFSFLFSHSLRLFAWPWLPQSSPPLSYPLWNTHTLTNMVLCHRLPPLWTQPRSTPRARTSDHQSGLKSPAVNLTLSTL